MRSFLCIAVLLATRPVSASYLGFESPASWTRGAAANSTYQEWDVFTSVDPAPPLNVPDQGIYNTPALPAIHDVYDTSGSSFLTGGGNIYSFALPVDIDVVVPNYDLGSAGWTTAVLQSVTLGSTLDLSSVHVVSGGQTFHPVDSALLFTQPLGGFGGVQEDRWFEFHLPGNAASYTFEMLGSESSVSVDRVAVDTIWSAGNLPVDEPNPVPLPVAAVVGRHVFYNRSRFDGNDPAITADDDAAIATDKQPLLPGSTASLVNYTSYSRGLNGVMVDMAGLRNATAIGADDFSFRVGNSNNPATWVAAAPPSNVVVREGAGESGADRIELVWNDGAIAKTWLQVVLLANSDTGLAADDVFYFGNAIGEAGNSQTDVQVNAADELAARGNPRNIANLAPIDFLDDYNRDQQVNAADQLIARGNGTNLATALRLISVPALPSLAAAVPEPGAIVLSALGLAALALRGRVISRRRAIRR